MKRSVAAILVVGASLWTPHAATAITIPTVLVGNLGNAGQAQSQGTFGGVPYAYRIATTEVTNDQYAAFLNEKAQTDPYGLYNENMGVAGGWGGITRSGGGTQFDPFVYAIQNNMGDKPVVYVSWYDSIRFANWLSNGQGSGDTETGSYTLGPLGDGGVPTDGVSIHRNVAASWFLPSENEWYKAAYHQPAAQGGDSDDYWAYPTGKNSAPTLATAIDAAGLTRGDIANPGSNVANYNSGADWNGHNGNVTTVGSAGSSSQSFYGTSDQGGNAWEWNEALPSPSNRGFRGGSWEDVSSVLLASSRFSIPPNFTTESVGLRVATIARPQFPGDANFDAAVDFIDLGILLNHYDQASEFATGDFDYSGMVDFIDLGMLLNNYNEQAPAAAVPEPSTLALAAIGTLGLLITARRKR